KLELAAETTRIRQLIEDQERKIKIWKDNYNQLLDEIKNKQDIMLKESLNDILNNNLKQFLITEIIEKNKNIETRVGFNEFKSKKTFSYIKNEYIKV
ncbi:6020_t:CDS:1, partial [Scutellospora calospora]